MQSYLGSLDKKQIRQELDFLFCLIIIGSLNCERKFWLKFFFSMMAVETKTKLKMMQHKTAVYRLILFSSKNQIQQSPILKRMNLCQS